MGDSQPRKRKEKRRKKEEEELYPHLKDTDEVIHVYKEPGLGGNTCTKIIFFCILTTLGVITGLTLFEYRGTTDSDVGQANLASWIPEFQWPNLIAVPDLIPDFFKGDESKPEVEPGEIDESEEKSWFNLLTISGGTGEGSWFDVFSGGAETKEEIHEESGEEGVDGADLSHEELDEALEEADDTGSQEEGEELDGSQEEGEELDESQAEEEELEGSQEEELEGSQEELGSQEATGSLEEELGTSQEDIPESQEDPTGSLEEEEEPFLYRNAQSEEDEPDDDQLENVSLEELDKENEPSEETRDSEDEPTFDSDTNVRREPTGKETSEEELFPEAIEALRQEATELLKQQNDPEPDAEALTDEVDETEDSDDVTQGMALKFGVGVALVVVAHFVLIKKWNSWDESVRSEKVQVVEEQVPELVEEPKLVPVEERPPAASPVEPPPDPVELEAEEEYEEDVEDGEEVEEEEEEEESEEEPPLNPKIYEELIAKYGQPTPESSDGEQVSEEYSEDAGEEEESVGEEESINELEESEPEDIKPTWKVQNEEMLETESENESEDEPPPPPPPKKGGARSEEINEDFVIQRDLDMADDEFNYDRLAPAEKTYRRVLQRRPESARALYGLARTLDKKANTLQSNAILTEAIQAYQTLLKASNVPDDIYKPAAARAINRMRFRGMHNNAIQVNELLIKRYGTAEYGNDLGISYLMVNRLSDAAKAFKRVVEKWPDNLMALAHLGLTLKLQGKLAESVPHFRAGLARDSKENRDTRLYYHFSDALARLGLQQEANQVNENAVSRGIFRSFYQRSQYNVDRLTGRPWWTLDQTQVGEGLRSLEVNWKAIREESLAALNLSGAYKNEAEGLKDFGDWKQFVLYIRGVKQVENCRKAPLTCHLVSKIEAARTCRRGQIKFSVMTGGTHVWPHCGPTNCRLRSHLGLVVPSGPSIRVANITKQWSEGRMLVFDDSFEHEVWHNGTSPRIVLIVDIWHPELTQRERSTLSAI